MCSAQEPRLVATDVRQAPSRAAHRPCPAVHRLGRVLGVCILLLCATRALAAEVTLTWEAPADPHVTGYRLYYGYASGSYLDAVDVGLETMVTLTEVADGQALYVAVAPYNADGDMGPHSAEILLEGAAADAEDAPDEAAPDEAAEAADLPAPDDLSDEAAARDDADDPPDTAADPDVIPPDQLSIVSVDSEPERGDGAAEAAIDGRPDTFWRTAMGAKAPRHPHEVVIALGGAYTVRGFRYLPRQDGQTDGMVTRYSFYVSADGVEWGAARHTGTLPPGTEGTEVTFAGTVGRFVRFVAHAELHGQPWTSVAEITIVGRR